MGTKEQGGPETFKIKTSYNPTEERFFISLTSRKTFHTARMNLTAEEFKVILDRMVSAYENVVYPRTPEVDPDNEMKGLKNDSRI